MADHKTKQFDTFISISDDLEDQKWVDDELEPAFKDAGISYVTSNQLSDDQYLVDALADAIDNSRYTLFVLTPAWNEKGRGEFEKALAQLEDPRGIKHHIIPLWLKDCPIPKTLKIYTKRDFRRKESQKLQTQILIGRLLPAPTTVSAVPRTLSAKLLTLAWEHPIRAGLLTLVLLVILSAMVGVPTVDGWKAVSQENLVNAKWITRIGQTLFVMTDTTGGCSDARDTGLWRSSDRGVRWERIAIRPLDATTPGGCVRAGIVAIAPSPVDPMRLYAATEDVGILVSTNGGTIWAALKSDLTPKQLTALGVMASPERLFAIGHASTGYGLYRTSLEGINWKPTEGTELKVPSEGTKWERIDGTKLCKQEGYKPLPSEATIIGIVLVVGNMVFVAPGDSLDQAAVPPESDLYYSADGGDCWRRVHDKYLDINYSALTAVPNTRSEILFAIWNRKELGRQVMRWNWEKGQDPVLIADLPLDASQIFVEAIGETWYASTPFGLLYRGSVKNSGNLTRLPGPFSVYAAFTSDFDGNAPLLLSGGRVFRRGTVGWWQGLWP